MHIWAQRDGLYNGHGSSPGPRSMMAATVAAPHGKEVATISVRGLGGGWGKKQRQGLKNTVGSVRRKMRRMKKQQHHDPTIERLEVTAFSGSGLLVLPTTHLSPPFSAHNLSPTFFLLFSFPSPFLVWSGFSTSILQFQPFPCTLCPSFVIYDPIKPSDLIQGPCSSLAPCLHHHCCCFSILVPPFLATTHMN